MANPISGIIGGFLELFTEVAKAWTPERRMRFQEKYHDKIEDLRKEENAQGAEYNDDRLYKANQKLEDFRVAFKAEIIAHNKENGYE